MSLVPRLNPKRLPPNQCPPVPPKCPLSPVLNPKRLNDLLSRKIIEVGANVTPVPSDSVSWILRPRWLQEMAKGAAGADGRGDAYGALARHVADIFRHRLRRVWVMTPSGSDFGCVRIGVRNNEQFLDVSWCFWGFGWTSTFKITLWAFDEVLICLILPILQKGVLRPGKPCWSHPMISLQPGFHGSSYGVCLQLQGTPLNQQKTHPMASECHYISIYIYIASFAPCNRHFGGFWR